MGLPAAGYISNASRTVAEVKAALEDQRNFIADLPGGAARNTLTIAGGSITPGSGTSGGVHSVDTEGAASADDLANITQTNTPDGRILTLYAANAARVVTVKHGAGGSGQMLLTHGADFVLNALDKWIKFQRLGSDWVEIARGYGIDYYGAQDVARIAPQIHDGVLCPAARLAIVWATAATLTITADSVVLFDSAGHAKKFGPLSDTLNIGNTGANGRDVVDNGGAEQANSWYHFFAIGKDDGTLDVFASQVGYPGSGTSIYTRLPAGYTWAGYLGADYNDSGLDLVKFLQFGDTVKRIEAIIVNLGNSTSYVSLGLGAMVPITARFAEVNCSVNPVSSSNGTGLLIGYVSPDTTDTYATWWGHGDFDGGYGAASPGWVFMTTPQQLYYRMSSATGQLSTWVKGWRYQ
jgi:hypothetical protein